MHVDLPQRAPLICPACRRLTERGRELWTLSVAAIHKLGASEDEISEGSLRCDNLECQMLYPIVDGIPIVVLDPAALVSAQPAALQLPLAVETQALLIAGSTDDAPLARLLEHLSIYLDAHYGDRSQPPPDGPVPGWGGAELFSAVARLAAAGGKVATAVELGCSVGRGLLAMGGGAELTLGIDLHLGALRVARRLCSGESLRYARRVIGRHYQAAQLTMPAAPNVQLVCADVLDPPLAPQAFSRVVACNLLDSVRTPRQLLSVVDGLCSPGGEVFLATPYSWQSSVVDESGRIGGLSPERELRRIFETGDGLEAAYTIAEEAERPWHLRRDARSAHSYIVHTLHGRKNG
jgi:SAM-dependent methyltransferase/uncharacterized protein YbaR (Trm112 family)